MKKLKEITLEDLNRDFKYRKFDTGNEISEKSDKLEGKSLKKAIEIIFNYYEYHPDFKILKIIYILHEYAGYVFLVKTSRKPRQGAGYCAVSPLQLFKVTNEAPYYVSNVDATFCLRISEKIAEYS